MTLVEAYRVCKRPASTSFRRQLLNWQAAGKAMAWL